MTYIQIDLGEVEEKIEAPNRLFFEPGDILDDETVEAIADAIRDLEKEKPIVMDHRFPSPYGEKVSGKSL